MKTKKKVIKKKVRKKPIPKHRTGFEMWLDKYNHTMELIRTLVGIATIALQILILFILTNG